MVFQSGRDVTKLDEIISNWDIQLGFGNTNWEKTS